MCWNSSGRYGVRMVHDPTAFDSLGDHMLSYSENKFKWHSLCPLIQILGVTIWLCVESCWLAPAATLLITSTMPSHGPFPCDVAKKKKNSLLSKLHSWRTVKTLHCAPAHRCINTPSLYHAVLSKIRNYMFFKHTHTHTHTQLAVRARFHVTTTLTLVFGEVTLKSVSKHSLHSYVPWHVAHLSCTLRMILRGGNISSSVMLRSLFYLVSLPLQS